MWRGGPFCHGAPKFRCTARRQVVVMDSNSSDSDSLWLTQGITGNIGPDIKDGIIQVISKIDRKQTGNKKRYDFKINLRTQAGPMTFIVETEEDVTIITEKNASWPRGKMKPTARKFMACKIWFSPNKAQ